MGYVGERNLEQEVNSVIDSRIRSMVENKIKQHITDSNEYVFENKKFYLKEDVRKGLNINVDMISGWLSNQITSSVVDVRKINYSVIDAGQKLFYHETIDKYVNDILSNIKF